MVFNNEIFYETKYKNYYVSKTGKFLSCTRLGIKLYTNMYIDLSGYYKPILSYYENSKRIVKRIYLHKLVAETFLGDKPKNFVIDHINYNKLDNNITNLRYVSNEFNLSRSHKNVKPKLKMRTFITLNGFQYIFSSITKAYKFLNLNRHQYERIKNGAMHVKNYKIISWEERNKNIFMCLTTNADECKHVDSKQMTIEMGCND